MPANLTLKWMKDNKQQIAQIGSAPTANATSGILVVRNANTGAARCYAVTSSTADTIRIH